MCEMCKTCYSNLLQGAQPLSEEDSIRWLVDEAYKAARVMIHTHSREDITYFIILARHLELHGYIMTWSKGRHIVGAIRKDIHDQQRSTGTHNTVS
jgi:hypothetical protein